MRPLAKAATMLPPTAFRFDPGAAITVFARYLPQILTGGADGLKLLGSFKKVLPPAPSFVFGTLVFFAHLPSVQLNSSKCGLFE